MKHNIINLFANKIKQNNFTGDFLVDIPTRIINSSDNSIYEVMPLAVAQPRNSSDVQILLSTAQDFETIYFCPRGGGTGTNGQSLTDGVVIDLSRFMNNILELDTESCSVIVESGVVLGELNKFLAPHGLFFAPNVSTSDRATIGGMIATDAAGKGSLIYGKTADHFTGMQLILANGDVVDTITSKPKKELQKKLEEKIVELLEPVQDEIEAKFPPLKRPLSGYNIKQCYQDNTINLERLIAGSEGTLGIVAKARLKLLSIPKYRSLVVVHYPSFMEALQDAQFLIQFNPLAIEAIDEKVQQSAQTLPNWKNLAKILGSEGQTYISNFVEFVADTKEELDNIILSVQAALDIKKSIYVIVLDNYQINQLWSIRSLAVGLAGKIPGSRKPVAFVEDAIVPPENLASFVQDLQNELNELNLNYAMYGHVDVGCIHVRPALNMQDPLDRAQIRPITETMIKLLDKYNGILWGEHGKGYRGEFVPDVFGKVLYPVLCDIKKLFDPLNRLNPGKLTAPDSQSKLTRIELVPMRGELDQIITKQLQTKFSDAILCNGNGACFSQDINNVMCPSYKITKDRIHSPKGRAVVLKQWMRENSKIDGNDKQLAHDTYEAMNGCLGCKACAGKCPTQVSIPNLRTNFLNTYHKKYKKRNLREIILANIETLIPLASTVSKIWNTAQKYNMASYVGLVNIPIFKNKTRIKKQIKDMGVDLYTNQNQIKHLNNPVVIFTDVFNGYLDRDVLISSINSIQKLGFTPYVMLPQKSGKAFIVAGMIESFQKNTQNIAKLINPLFEANIPVIALENTITSLFRDEVVKYATSFVGQVSTISEFLLLNLDKITTYTSTNNKYRLLPHCTEQAVLSDDSNNWKLIFKKIGFDLEIKNQGCCGMAGTYGHLKEQQNNSEGLFNLNWATTVQDTYTINMASGFSCRSQANRLVKQEIPHPIQIIDTLIQ